MQSSLRIFEMASICYSEEGERQIVRSCVSNTLGSNNA
jgi:hypothetical protein